MTAGIGAGRIIVLALGLTMFVAGLAVIAAGKEAAISGIWLVCIGMVFIIATVIERVRYRSDAAERGGAPSGPGGGEPIGTRLDTRFSRSDEVFEDPTSGRRMRVWLDPSTGERRYLSED
jgi:hypothetical protein